MLYATLAACATLIFVLILAVSHAAKAHRLARLYRSQQKWADLMNRHDSPADYNAVFVSSVRPSSRDTLLSGRERLELF